VSFLAPPQWVFPFLTSFYGNDGTKFTKKVERRLSLSSSSPARRDSSGFHFLKAYHFVVAVWRAKEAESGPVKHWEIIPDNLNEAGWSAH